MRPGRGPNIRAPEFTPCDHGEDVPGSGRTRRFSTRAAARVRSLPSNTAKATDGP